jgi:hypothetical protein
MQCLGQSDMNKAKVKACGTGQISSTDKLSNACSTGQYFFTFIILYPNFQIVFQMRNQLMLLLVFLIILLDLYSN